MTDAQEQQLRALLANALKYEHCTGSQEDEEWTDPHQYGENAYDAYHSGIQDGRTAGEISLARKVLDILDQKVA
jgi:hypothetical protein